LDGEKKKRINAEVALRKCPQGKLRALSSLRRVEEEKKEIPQPRTGRVRR